MSHALFPPALVTYTIEEPLHQPQRQIDISLTIAVNFDEAHPFQQIHYLFYNGEVAYMAPFSYKILDD